MFSVTNGVTNTNIAYILALPQGGLLHHAPTVQVNCWFINSNIHSTFLRRHAKIHSHLVALSRTAHIRPSDSCSWHNWCHLNRWSTIPARRGFFVCSSQHYSNASWPTSIPIVECLLRTNLPHRLIKLDSEWRFCDSQRFHHHPIEESDPWSRSLDCTQCHQPLIQSNFPRDSASIEAQICKSPM